MQTNGGMVKVKYGMTGNTYHSVNLQVVWDWRFLPNSHHAPVSNRA